MIRSRVRQLLVRSPGLCRVASKATARVGATAISEALGRAANEMARVPLPPSVTDRAGSSLVMMTRYDSDLVARIVRDQGWDAFERPMPAVYAACVRARDGHVLDVGANTGFYSILAGHARPGVAITAFEPFPPVVAHLRENLRLNGLDRKVTIVDKAVGATPGQTTLYVPLQDHGLVETSCTMNPEFKDEYSAAIDVPVTTVDAELAGRDTPQVSLIKIDVESLEHEVLKGAFDTINRDQPYLFVEVLPVGDLGAIEELRRAFGYADVRLHPDRATIGDRIEFVADAWNHLLVPDAEIDNVAALLRGVGLQVG